MACEALHFEDLNIQVFKTYTSTLIRSEALFCNVVLILILSFFYKKQTPFFYAHKKRRLKRLY
jgi:hypothetical protein